MSEFLFHKISDEERVGIKLKAKKIVDSFSKKLESVKGLKEGNFIEIGKGLREEGKGSECDELFRKTILENAPEKNKDFILAEKKSW